MQNQSHQNHESNAEIPFIPDSEVEMLETEKQTPLSVALTREAVQLNLDQQKQVAKTAEKLKKYYSNDKKFLSTLDRVDGYIHRSIAQRLIEDNLGYMVVDHLKSFQGLDYIKIIALLIQHKQPEAFVNKLDKFWINYYEKIDHSTLANMMIDGGYGQLIFQANIGDLDSDVFLRLIQMGFVKEVITHLNESWDLSLPLAQKLIDEGYSKEVASLALHFSREIATQKQLALMLSQAGNFDLFHNRNFIPDPLFENNSSPFDNEVASKMVEMGHLDELASHLKYFRGLSKSTLIKLIEGGHSESVVYAIKNKLLRNIDWEVAKELIKHGWEGFVDANIHLFSNNGKQKKRAA